MFSEEHIQYINDNDLKAYFESSLVEQSRYNKDIIESMVSGKINMVDNMEVLDEEGDNAIAYAVVESMYDAIQPLLDAGADVNVVNEDTISLLESAVMDALYASGDKK